MFPDASCEPERGAAAADRQQLRVPAVPAVLLPEVRQQGERLTGNDVNNNNKKKT